MLNPAGTVYWRAARRLMFWFMNTTNHTSHTTKAPAMIAPTATAATTWTVDPIHTTVGFGIRHLMVTTVRGVFERATGTVRYAAEQPEAAQIEIAIEAASVSTHDRQRDEHLRNADFFDVATHPIIRFRSIAVRRTPGGGFAVDGELTLRGITRPITLEVGEVTRAHRDFRGVRRVGASATAKLLRSDFGITYNILLEAGGIALADEVSLTIDLSLVEQAAR
jgi:polyisoprenoid-binding protein YceI